MTFPAVQQAAEPKQAGFVATYLSAGQTNCAIVLWITKTTSTATTQLDHAIRHTLGSYILSRCIAILCYVG
jgi:hypothetical protein